MPATCATNYIIAHVRFMKSHSLRFGPHCPPATQYFGSRGKSDEKSRGKREKRVGGRYPVVVGRKERKK